MDQEKEKIFSLGRRYELGETTFDNLTDMEKFDLMKYFSMKTDYFNNETLKVTNSLNSMDSQLSTLYDDLKNFNN